MDSQSIDTTSAVNTGPVEHIDCVDDDSVVAELDDSVVADVDEQTICEQFYVAMKDENPDRRSLDADVENLKEMLRKPPATTLKVTISGGNLRAVTNGRKTFNGMCKGYGKGIGLMYKKDEKLYPATNRFQMVRAGPSATIFFLGGSSINPLGIFTGKVDPSATATENGPGKWTK